MSDSPPRTSGYAIAWVVVFLSTVMSGIAAIWSITIVAVATRSNSLGPTSQSSFRIMVFMTIAAAIVGAAAGVISATLCAFGLRFLPVRRLVMPIFVPSIVVGVLTAPIFHIFSALFVVVTQVLASILLAPSKHDDRGEDQRCGTCLYPLAGLDRTRTEVCPECGEALPFENEAEEEEEER